MIREIYTHNKISLSDIENKSLSELGFESSNPKYDHLYELGLKYAIECSTKKDNESPINFLNISSNILIARPDMKSHLPLQEMSQRIKNRLISEEEVISYGIPDDVMAESFTQFARPTAIVYPELIPELTPLLNKLYSSTVSVLNARGDIKNMGKETLKNTTFCLQLVNPNMFQIHLRYYGLLESIIEYIDRVNPETEDTKRILEKSRLEVLRRLHLGQNISQKDKRHLLHSLEQNASQRHKPKNPEIFSDLELLANMTIISAKNAEVTENGLKIEYATKPHLKKGSDLPITKTFTS